MGGYLSDVTRRRIGALLLVAIVVVATLAAADLGPFSNPPTQEELAKDSVVDFFDAAHDSDFAGMCELLTPTAQQQILERLTAVLPTNEEVRGCRDALTAQDKLSRSSSGQSLGATRVTQVVDSRVAGNHAVVDVELAFPGTKRHEQRTFQLELVRGQWRIANAGTGL
jgi:hypothetical protein